MVLENKSLHTLKDPEKDEEDADILNPGKFDGFPEARTVGGWRWLRHKLQQNFHRLCAFLCKTFT